MKTMFKILTMTTFIVLTATAIFATDLDNQDSRDYDVKVRTSSASTMNYTIYHGSIKSNICSGPCEIEIVGVGTVRVTGKETVVIKNGKIIVR